MRLTPISESAAEAPRLPEPRDVSGIALFMVMSAIGILSILVTEFSYIAQINQRMAYDSLDQVKAHYLAKGGLKLSLLRLKAYAQLKSLTGGSGGGSGGAGANPLAGAIPRSVLDKVWNFPFMYPIPSLPDLTVSQKDQIQEFQKSSDMDGRYTAVIESESSKYNINLILPGFAPRPSASPSPSSSPGTPPGTNPSPNPSASYDPKKARDSLKEYLANLIFTKSQSDEDFQREYQDYRLDDLIDYIAQWADHSYEGTLPYPQTGIPPKRAPFYSLTELHQIPTIDDDLYKLFANGLTVSTTPGININTMQEPTLHALVPQMTADEIADFFKFRDDPTADNYFKKDTDFFDYLTKNVSAFRGDASQVQQIQQNLRQKNIILVTDESEFKITVQAQVNQAVRTFEAWVTLTGVGQTGPVPLASGAPNPQNSPAPDTGLKINFVRIL